LTITFVDAVVSGDDQVWNAGEDLTVTVLIGADIDVNYPGIVSRTDNPQVTVNWQSDITYLVGSEFTYEAHAVFQAGPDMDPQTLVHLEVAASTAVGQVSACDCPDVDVDAWIGTFTIE
ncbi:MAG: hypothetical protein KC457_17255, partial [Myxococcales bacterium]|nr:hypothetical protein [Myxococcales bacterium]